MHEKRMAQSSTKIGFLSEKAVTEDSEEVMDSSLSRKANRNLVNNIKCYFIQSTVILSAGLSRSRI